MASMAIAAFGAAGIAGSGGALLSTAGTVLQGIATAGSVLTGFMQAQQSRAAGEAAAAEAIFNGQMEQRSAAQDVANSEAKAVELRREALRKIGAARVAFGASGLDISSGQLSSIESNIERDTEFGVDLEKSNQRIRIAQSRIKQTQFDSQAINARSSGKSRAVAAQVGALGKGASGLLSIVRRG